MTDATKTMSLMKGAVEVVLYDVGQPSAGRFFDSIHDEAVRLRRIFDFYNPASELSTLNRKRELEVSDELAEVLGMALRYSPETGGAYDVTIGRRILARKQGQPLPERSCSFRDVHIDDNTVSLTHPDALLDLGSIAKGYIGDKIIRHMQDLGLRSGFVDARGDMRIYGEHLEVVEVQHPRDPNRRLKPIVLENAAVATSGDYRQYYGSFENSHIIGETDFASVTVVAEYLAHADAMASCVFLLGSREAGRFLEKHPEAKAFAVDRSLSEYAYNGFEKLLLTEAENAV